MRANTCGKLGRSGAGADGGHVAVDLAIVRQHGAKASCVGSESRGACAGPPHQAIVRAAPAQRHTHPGHGSSPLHRRRCRTCSANRDRVRCAATCEHSSQRTPCASAPAMRVLRLLLARSIHMQQTTLLDQVRNTYLRRQPTVQRWSVCQQHPQRSGSTLHARLGPSGRQVAQQPRHCLWQVAPAHRKRPHRIGEPTGHLAPRARSAGGMTECVDSQPEFP